MIEARTAELLGIIEKNTIALDRLFDSLEQAMKHDIAALGRTSRSALIIAGLLENYYTCLETMFLRVSQFFENNLSPTKWHMDLLEKMTLRLEGVRIPVVSQTNHANLLELLKFRHFKRYYFELEYDWDRLDFLILKIRSAHPTVKADIDRFTRFLRDI